MLLLGGRVAALLRAPRLRVKGLHSAGVLQLTDQLPALVASQLFELVEGVRLVDALLASAGFVHDKRGMSSAHVRRLLGKPDDWERYRERGVREICWYYGSFAVKRGEFEFCFRREKLVSKSRFSG